MTSCPVSDAASKIIASGGRRPAVIQASVCVNLSWQKDFRTKGLYMRGTREVSERSGVFMDNENVMGTFPWPNKVKPLLYWAHRMQNAIEQNQQFLSRKSVRQSSDEHFVVKGREGINHNRMTFTADVILWHWLGPKNPEPFVAYVLICSTREIHSPFSKTNT